ncbi:MAG: peptidoglycan DD-metalloendopeptidase family protein [Geminicoccaceae bacterium]|nr:peptidoglycan DD-metalloendopeptidase family protein [Geminicoccaceae bacterium]MDW8369033.1 peptidoglycan DD-metalloendopeptidase family protein [Geminicoccaceae bacterium]
MTESLEEIDWSRQAVDELERATREPRRSASTLVLQTVRIARGEAEPSGSGNRGILQLRFGDAWRRLEDRLARARATLVAAQRAGLIAAAELATDAAAWADAGAASSAAESALREVQVGLLEAELRRTALLARLPVPTQAAIAEANSGPDLEEMTASLGGEPRHGNRSGWSGVLRMPVEGTVVQRFGDRRGHQRARGIVLAAERSQPVLAPGAGTVAFAGPFRGFGSVLIIEHGEDYHSLVIGVSKLVVGQGEVVAAGQPVGWWAGAGDGANELYLELRKAGEPIDPLPMFTGREDEVRG